MPAPRPSKSSLVEDVQETLRALCYRPSQFEDGMQIPEGWEVGPAGYSVPKDLMSLIFPGPRRRLQVSG